MAVGFSPGSGLQPGLKLLPPASLARPRGGHLPRLVSQPGVKPNTFTPDWLVPDEIWGLKPLSNRGNSPFFY